MRDHAGGERRVHARRGPAPLADSHRRAVDDAARAASSLGTPTTGGRDIRRALQRTADARPPVVGVPSELAAERGIVDGTPVRVSQGGARVVLPARVDASLARQRDPRRRGASAHRAARADVRPLTIEALAGERRRCRDAVVAGGDAVVMTFDAIHSYGSGLLGGYWPVVWTLTKIVALVVPLLLCVAYLTLWERKAIGWTQIRLGPEPRRPARPAAADRRRASS